MIFLYFLLSTSLIAFGLLSLRQIPWAAPGRLLAMVILFYGLVAKPIFVAISVPSEDFIDTFILSPLTRSDYWEGSVALLGFYWLFVFAMVFTARHLAKFRKPEPRAVDRPRLLEPGRASVLLIVGLLGFAVFMWENPILLTGGNKNSLASADLNSYSGSGVLRLVTSMLSILPFLMLVNIGNEFKVRASRAILWLSSIAWIAFAFMSDQRGLILFSMLAWIVAYNMFIGKPQRKYLLLMLCSAIGVVVIKTASRLTSDDVGTLDLFNEIIGNYIGRNFVENGKTLLIVKSIPESLPFAYGASYLDSFLILIPRSLFPTKLTVNLDTIIGNAVFDCGTFGACAVPPGLIAESYLNFGLLWVIVSVLLCGWMTAWLDWKSANGSHFFRIFYVSNLVYFGISLLGSSVASFTTQAIAHLLVLWPAYSLLKRTTRWSTRTASPGEDTLQAART